MSKKVFQFILFFLIICFSACAEKVSVDSPSLKNSKHEIALIYIGSTQCAVCLDASNKNYFKKIHNSIIAEHANIKFSVKRIGISIGNNNDENFNFLQSFDLPFDEITLSHDLFNTGMNRYIHSDFKGEAVVPQVIIMKRSYHQNNLDDSPVNTSIESENLLYRLVNLPNIETFSEISKEIDYTSFFKE
jgi:hypothetical protein